MGSCGGLATWLAGPCCPHDRGLTHRDPGRFPLFQPFGLRIRSGAVLPYAE